MSYLCYACKAALSLSSGKVSRSECCPKCNCDLHCCLACKFYDEKAYNQCSEPQAERVLDKDRANFCDYFEMNRQVKGGTGKDSLKNERKKLDDLFK